MTLITHAFGLLVMSACLCLGAGAAAAQEAGEERASDAPWSMADDYYDAEEMARARAAVQAANGDQRHGMLMVDRLEWQSGSEEGALIWDGEGWYGGDTNKLWIKTEGEYSFEEDGIEDAEIQALWSHAISSYFDVQAGLRYDLEPKGRTHAVIGVQGLAPYWFEVDAAAFVSTQGDLTARVEVEYDFLLSQRLILQPRAELEVSAQEVAELGLGAGLAGLDAGVRLRYEIKREFAPYIGAEWQKSFGDTADFIEAAGGDTDEIRLIIGVKAWF